MSETKSKAAEKEMQWTPALIKMLRGKRTLLEFGEMIGAPKNTVWRWEAGHTSPDVGYSEKLSRLAEQEHFLEDWQLAGSAEIIGNIEEGSRLAAESFKKSIARTIDGING